MNLWTQIEIYVLTLGISWLQGNAQQIEKDLAPYIQDGENAIIAAVSKLSPSLGALLQAALTALGPDLPKFEGDAVAWLVAVAQAYLKKLQG
ncbi:MAG TPA: hypothetical protein VGG51_07830 [Candidatus Cybelea sp.]|jgi:hypothetical protein